VCECYEVVRQEFSRLLPDVRGWKEKADSLNESDIYVERKRG
jgi:hypothetical protein